MSFPISITIDQTDEGGFRAELPGQTIVGATVDELLDDLKPKLAELVIQSQREAPLTPDDTDELQALREIEKTSPDRAALEKLAARFPAPQEWYDEPE